jgi:hypothetical protein
MKFFEILARQQATMRHTMTLVALLRHRDQETTEDSIT